MIDKCGVEGVVGSGVVVVGGRTVREVVPFVKKIRECVDSDAWEHVALDTVLSAPPGSERWLTRQVYIELVVNDEVCDPRCPWNTRTKLFQYLLMMYRHYKCLMIVIPVTYRGFYLSGYESRNLKERLDKYTYRSSCITLETSKGLRSHPEFLRALAYDFNTQGRVLLATEDTYNEESEWFRADGRCKCSTCGREYREHPEHLKYKFLRELCSGQLVKL